MGLGEGRLIVSDIGTAIAQSTPAPSQIAV
jgi:hypothetical protein